MRQDLGTTTERGAAAGGWGAELLPSPPLVQVLGVDGSRRDVEGFPVDLGPEELRALHRWMVLGRRADRQAITLARQGQLAVYASSAGQEAAQVGSVLALAPQDWVVPSYRETVALMARGLDVVEVLATFKGTWNCGYDARAHRVAPLSIPIGTQALHAAGIANAARLSGDPVVALTYFGDGATSEGDPHEAMNFAAVFGAPCVFFVQNNGFAISVPLARQTKAPSLAHKAVGYGMPGYRVDGNDVLAVHAATRRAVEQARRGEGPSLVEAVTYRIEAHTTADDPLRYRDAGDVAVWEQRDPLLRFERYLAAAGLLDPAWRAEVAAEAEALAERVRTELSRPARVDPLELFAHVYAEPPPHLAEQRALLAGELEAAG